MSSKITPPHIAHEQKAAREKWRVGVKNARALGSYEFPRLLRCVLAGCATFLVVWGIAILPQSLISRIGPTLLFAVVLLSSWYGGFGPGVLAAISAVAGTELLSPTSATPLLTRTADTVLVVMLTTIAYALSSIKRRRTDGGPLSGRVGTRQMGAEASSTYYESVPPSASSAVTDVGKSMCSTCGASAPFQDPTNGANLRESLICPVCGSNSRDRMLMYGLAVSLGRSFPIRDWHGDPSFRIFETTGYRGHPRYLGDKFDYYNTRYDPEKIAAGADARSYADIQSLPYPDEFFDCVLSSDVFEHVRLDDLGFQEIFRVLKPNGTFVLQAPYGHVPQTHVLVRPEGDKDIFLEPPQYHAEHTLVYRIYGRDLLDRLRDLGFSVARLHMAIPEYGISEQDTFLARKSTYNEFISVA
jgi:SAM-dependent methyltransferase